MFLDCCLSNVIVPVCQYQLNQLYCSYKLQTRSCKHEIKTSTQQLRPLDKFIQESANFPGKADHICLWTSAMIKWQKNRYGSISDCILSSFLDASLELRVTWEPSHTPATEQQTQLSDVLYKYGCVQVCILCTVVQRTGKYHPAKFSVCN